MRVLAFGGPKDGEWFEVSDLRPDVFAPEINVRAGFTSESLNPFDPMTTKVRYELVKLGFFGRLGLVAYVDSRLSEDERAHLFATRLLSDTAKQMESEVQW